MREKWARTIALLTGALVVLLAGIFAHFQSPVKTLDTTESKKTALLRETLALDPKRIAAGRRVYQQQTCARYHSIAGEGNPRNSLDGVGARRTRASCETGSLERRRYEGNFQTAPSG